MNHYRFGLLAAFLGCASFCLHAESEAKKGQKADTQKKQKSTAAELIHDIERAVAYTVKAAKKIKLDPKNKKYQYFFGALKKVSLGTDAMAQGVKAKDHTFFAAIDATGKAVSDLKTAVGKTDIRDKDLISGIKNMANAHALLRQGYGKIAVRAKGSGRNETAEGHARATENSGRKAE